MASPCDQFILRVEELDGRVGQVLSDCVTMLDLWISLDKGALDIRLSHVTSYIKLSAHAI